MTKKDIAEMVNRDPFAPVRLTQFMDNGVPTDKVYIQIQKEDDQGWAVPTGTAIVHGKDYRLISNQQMHDMMMSVIDEVKRDNGVEFEPLPSPGSMASSLVWNGKAYRERWFSRDVKVKTPAGGEVMLGIECRNSYDKTSRAQLAFFAMHCVCQNQFHSRNLFGTPFSTAHVGADGELEELDAAVKMVAAEAANFGKILPKIENLCNAHLFTMNDYLDFLDDCEAKTGLVVNDAKLRKELRGDGCTKLIKGLNVDYSQYGDRDSLWALTNAFTALTTHELPGITGAEKSARFVDFAIDFAEKLVANTIEV